jgi:peptidoglycan/xylan/chitin deacetylase (PgdA/CDA1 family)
MESKSRADWKRPFFICCLILTAAIVGGCATFQTEDRPVITPPVTARTFPDFIAIQVQEGDTLSSLSAKYLNDPSMDWFIAGYNDIYTLESGQELIIPLKPYGKGGLTAKEYQTVPVLSYHNFSLTEANKMTVTKTAFEEQMKLLKDKGYRVITMDQLFDFLEFKSQIPKKSVVITIDDGWRSAYDIALPILKKYGYPVTLFIYTDLIRTSEKTLSWELIQEMTNTGIADVHCHTKTHRNLTVKGKKESFSEYFETLKKEISECAAIVKKKLNREVKYLSYPFGETNHLIIEMLKKHGYRGAFTVTRGGNPFFIHNYRLNRSMIYGDFDLNQFEKNLNVLGDKALK